MRKDDGINAYFGNRDINEITTYDLRDYISYLDENRDEPLSPSSKSKHLVIIGKIFKVAYEKDVLDKMPLLPKVSKKDNPRPSFTEKEYKLLLKTTLLRRRMRGPKKFLRYKTALRYLMKLTSWVNWHLTKKPLK